MLAVLLSISVRLVTHLNLTESKMTRLENQILAITVNNCVVLFPLLGLMGNSGAVGLLGQSGSVEVFTWPFD